MSTQPFLVALLIASGLLAAWCFVRFPRLADVGHRGVTFGIIGTFCVFGFGPAALMAVGRPLGAIPAAFLVALPGLTYVFVVGILVMAYVRRAIEPFLK